MSTVRPDCGSFAPDGQGRIGEAPRKCWSTLEIFYVVVTASTAFRKFVLSYGRLFGHGILGYREQSRDEFSRPFGKEAPYANAHCSPHHFIAKRSYGSASGRARSFHTTITGVTRTHCLKGCELDRPTNLKMGHELGCSNLTVGKGRRRYLAWAYRVCKMPCAQGVRERLPPPRVSGHCGGQCVARTGSPRHQVDIR